MGARQILSFAGGAFNPAPGIFFRSSGGAVTVAARGDPGYWPFGERAKSRAFVAEHGRWHRGMRRGSSGGLTRRWCSGEPPQGKLLGFLCRISGRQLRLMAPFTFLMDMVCWVGDERVFDEDQESLCAIGFGPTVFDALTRHVWPALIHRLRRVSSLSLLPR